MKHPSLHLVHSGRSERAGRSGQPAEQERNAPSPRLDASSEPEPEAGPDDDRTAARDIGAETRPEIREDAGVRAQFKRLLDVVRANEELGKRFFALETTILGILEFRDFFKRLLDEIEDKFQAPCVWLTIVEESPAAEFLRDAETRRALSGRLKLLPRRRFETLTNGGQSPMLANRDLELLDELRPGGRGVVEGSLAVVPIFCEGRPAGSLNLADADPQRFRPELDTLFLSRLSAMVSLCLSNVEAHERLARMAREDPLTGLANRRVMEAALEAEVDRCRASKTPLSVVFIDMDDFKAVNDAFGHDQGDEFLRQFSRRLKDAIRPCDLAARFAGDEFVCVMPGLYADEARRVMDALELRCKREGLPLGEDRRAAMGFTYGVAQAGLGGDRGVANAGALLRRADARLYQYKRRKKLERARDRRLEADIEAGSGDVGLTGPEEPSDPAVAGFPACSANANLPPSPPSLPDSANPINPSNSAGPFGQSPSADLVERSLPPGDASR